MGEVHRLPNPADTEQEASDWFARMHADDVTADDRARFEAWLHAHSCNESAYAELECHLERARQVRSARPGSLLRPGDECCLGPVAASAALAGGGRGRDCRGDRPGRWLESL